MLLKTQVHIILFDRIIDVRNFKKLQNLSTCNKISKAATKTFHFSVVDKKLNYNRKQRLRLEIYYGDFSPENRDRPKRKPTFHMNFFL